MLRRWCTALLQVLSIRAHVHMCCLYMYICFSTCCLRMEIEGTIHSLNQLQVRKETVPAYRLLTQCDKKHQITY